MDGRHLVFRRPWDSRPPAIALPLVFVLGVLLLFATLHLARGVARVHGNIAKNLLVKSG